MADVAETREGFRFVVRDTPSMDDKVRVGVWTPSGGYLSATELELPRAVLAEVTANGPLVDVYGEQKQTSIIRFTDTGTIDLRWLFHQLVAGATTQELTAPIFMPEREYCGWSWPVVPAS